MRYWLAAVLCVAIIGCGGGSKENAKCGKVPIGDQDGTIYGVVDAPENVDCATARKVVQEWGRQQVGSGNYFAQLPSGWHCSATASPDHRVETAIRAWT